MPVQHFDGRRGSRSADERTDGKRRCGERDGAAGGGRLMAASLDVARRNDDGGGFGPRKCGHQLRTQAAGRVGIGRYLRRARERHDVARVDRIAMNARRRGRDGRSCRAIHKRATRPIPSSDSTAFCKTESSAVLAFALRRLRARWRRRRVRRRPSEGRRMRVCRSALRRGRRRPPRTRCGSEGPCHGCPPSGAISRRADAFDGLEGHSPYGGYVPGAVNSVSPVGQNASWMECAT